MPVGDPDPFDYSIYFGDAGVEVSSSSYLRRGEALVLNAHINEAIKLTNVYTDSTNEPSPLQVGQISWNEFITTDNTKQIWPLPQQEIKLEDLRFLIGEQGLPQKLLDELKALREDHEDVADVIRRLIELAKLVRLELEGLRTGGVAL